MKSCRCVRCNVAAARFVWGFALLVRDGWAVSDSPPLALAPDGEWLCPTCSARVGRATPRLGKPSPLPVSISRRSRARGTLRILLVDDEDLVRRCTARALAEFEVVSVASGAEALELLEEDQDFNAVLSDVMMPRMTGPELFAHCRHRYPAPAQRFVFASGNPEVARAELMRAVAASGGEYAPILLAKPSPREQLLLALYSAAARAEPRSGTYAVADSVVTEVKIYRG